MTKKINQPDERILDVYLAEYNHVTSSILAGENGRRQIINLTVAILAGSASAVTLFQSQPIFYLFGAILMALLTWSMLEETARTGIHNRYLRTVLGPKVEKLLNAQKGSAFQYTQYAFDVNPSTTITSALAPMKYLILLGLTGLLCVLFVFEKKASNLPWSDAETIIYFATIVVSFFPVFLGILAIGVSIVNSVHKSFKENILKNIASNKASSSPSKRKRPSDKK